MSLPQMYSHHLPGCDVQFSHLSKLSEDDPYFNTNPLSSFMLPRNFEQVFCASSAATCISLHNITCLAKVSLANTYSTTLAV